MPAGKYVTAKGEISSGGSFTGGHTDDVDGQEYKVNAIFYGAFNAVDFSSLTFNGNTVVFEGSFKDVTGLTGYFDPVQLIEAGSKF